MTEVGDYVLGWIQDNNGMIGKVRPAHQIDQWMQRDIRAGDGIREIEVITMLAGAQQVIYLVTVFARSLVFADIQAGNSLYLTVLIDIFSKRCESVNTIASFVWWIIGFYWVISGGEDLLQDAPRLYWLTVVFLAFDVFFAIFCVALACVIGIALCCCLPCIIAILYAVAGEEGASDADISILPRYRYAEPRGDGEKLSVEGTMIPLTSNSESSSDERVLLQEDAVNTTFSL
ncbi:uncharacterized protein A4U43_C06F15990 [Asparagus officinalis]|uniref:Uncharacterized protein n=1 Tax=Asparagus officinalis TaxID=4686 RepID=A0A5P1EPR1_ASPOF|nr:uncharacterized protein A4U43_C06F15990 [Asparagus officinalis]